ncbi:MAG: hypothetical protein JSR34_09780 [Proteobacteria bacterium]|nr:hypothetical protein [Pseudomonadota bacterium]
MNRIPRHRDPAWIGVLERIYAAALWLYPRVHREHFGTPMRLAFRDRCREAHREGRGPGGVLLRELLPDLAVSASRERIDAIAGLPPMKRMLLLALLCAFAATMVFHARLGDAAVALKDRWDQYQAELDNRALRAHEADLAAAAIQQRLPHADVLAAQLYFSAADGFRRRYPDASGLHETQAEKAAAEALLDRADAAFARALRADDRWALWLAVTYCPARESICAPEVSSARLREVDADNGAVWLLDLDQAKQAGDVSRQRADLTRMAQATRYDWHYGDEIRGMLAAFDLRPLPSRLKQKYADGSTATSADSASLMAGRVGSANATTAMTGAQTLFDLCKSTEPVVRADCRAAARLLADRGDGAIDRMLGLGLWRRVADASEREQVAQRYRDGRWQMQQYARVLVENSATVLHRWRAAWAAEPGEWQVLQRLLREQGIALQAPADFKVPDPR